MIKRRIAAILLALALVIPSASLAGNFFTSLIVGAVKTDDGGGYSQALAMLVMSYDWDEGGVRLLTLDRDEIVGGERLGQAMAVSGTDGALKAVNELYQLDIKNVVTIDMTNIPALVKSLGGVKVAIDEQEAEILGLDPGEVDMDEKTAKAYLAINLTQDAASEANSRRNNILNAVIDEARGGEIGMNFDLIWNGLGMVSSNISFLDFVSLGTSMLKSGMGGVKRAAVPIAGEGDQAELVKEFLYVN